MFGAFFVTSKNDRKELKGLKAHQLVSPDFLPPATAIFPRATGKLVRIHFKMAIFPVPSRPKLLQKNSLQRKCFEAINFVKITKESLYKTNSLACFLARRETPVAATLQRKSFG